MCSRPKKVSYRKIANINWDTFENDILHRISNIDSASLDLNECLDLYNTSVSEALEAHTPLKVKSVSARKTIPWFIDDITESIRLHLKLEQMWLKNRQDNDMFLDLYRQQQMVFNMLDSAEKEFFCGALEENRSNIKQVTTYKTTCWVVPRIYHYHQGAQTKN